MTRVGIGGFMHESNTFTTARTTLADFESGGLETGAGIRDRWEEAHHEVGGVFQGLSMAGAEPVPTLMGWATPSGPLTNETFHTLRQRLLKLIQAALPLDAFVLCQHGAMVAEGIDDADGQVVASVREVLGDKVPLVTTLDFHGNVSPLLVRSSDAVLAYRSYPHIDQRERGIRAVRLAIGAASGEIRPVTAICKPPLLVHLLKQATGSGPFESLMRDAIALESRDQVLDVSLLAGFPYADVYNAGVSCVVVADGDRRLADETARELAAHVWDQRLELTAQPPTPAEAVTLALRAAAHPVLLIDIGDNIGGGSAGDSTVLLHELRRQKAEGALAAIHDPAAVSVCRQAGEGASVRVSVGGRTDRNAPPFEVEGRVTHLSDGRYVEDLPRHGGIRHNDQGPTAVIVTDDHQTIVVNSYRHPPFSLRQFTSLGIDPARARFIVVKAALAYRAAYEPIAGTIIEVDTPGLTASNPARYTYERIRRPIFPLDPAATWTPEPSAP